MAEHQRTLWRLRPSEHRILLFLGDLLSSVLAVIGSLTFWKQYSLKQFMAVTGYPLQRALKLHSIEIPFWFYLLPLAWILLLSNNYDQRSVGNLGRTLRDIAIAALVGFIAYSLIFIFIQDPNSLPRVAVGTFLVLASLLTVFWRTVYIRIYTSPDLMRRVLVVGAGKSGSTLVGAYKPLNPPPFNLVGFIDDNPDKVGNDLDGFPVLGNSGQLLEIVEEQDISDIVVAITGEISGSTFQTILDIHEHGVDVTRMPIIYEEIADRVPVHHLETDWVIRSFVDQARVSGFYELFKRLLDIIGGLIGIGLFALSYPFTALAILFDSGRPIFYSQDRLGKGGQVFRIFKYRTMKQDAEADGHARLAEENDPRITWVGNFLRKSRLDELPQFLNILSGEMSLVGPRAERPELVDAFQKQIPFYRARLLCKPGLTGWAQVNYGYTSTVVDTGVKLEYDLYYIKHRNLILDISILLRTVGTVLSHRGR
ncbi:MAG: sugar transferase [Anaerolineales bacterium]|nr:sugar transferase [Anaerolineales bacterium]